MEEIFHKSVDGQLDMRRTAHKLPFSPSLKELFNHCKHCKDVFQVGLGIDNTYCKCTVTRAGLLTTLTVGLLRQSAE